MATSDLFQLLIDDYWENIQERDTLCGLSKEKDWYDALIHFKDYAYVRNMSGATSRYRKIAGIVLEPLRNRQRWSSNIEGDTWDKFKAECENRKIKPNEQVYPLKPSMNDKKSLEKFVWDITTPENPTIASWAFNMLKQNRLHEAHKQLKTVWGVGNKIASFYLRDIFWLGSNLSPNKSLANIDNIYLLQPVDIWVERAAKDLGFKGKSRKQIATFITSFEHKLRIHPGGGNIAFWLLGSNYVDFEDFDYIISAIISKSKNSKRHALATADYFISYYGRFGEILKSILE